MPVVKRIGPYRFMFFACDREEPPHVHVKRDRQEVKYWLAPYVELERNKGFSPHELTRIRQLIEDNLDELLDEWHDNFSD